MKKLFRTAEVVVFLLALLVALPLVVAADSATWTPTGSMSVARRDHTATLLTNGKVLIVGWSAASELYDPATGTFSPAGSTLVGHGQHSTATRLTDGRVLIVGGTDQHIAEIYDPATGTFSLTGSLNEVHSAHTATLLPDGRVLIAAGQDNAGPQTHAVAELYNPETGNFTVTGSLNDHRSGHTATLLPSGKVLITGGSQTTTPGFAISLSSAELYDPTTGTFSFTGSMNLPRWGHRATLLPSGKVLVAGVGSELYDPGSGTFALTGSMSGPRIAPTASLMPNGQVLIAGGGRDVAGAPNTINSAELYDPASETFTPTASMGDPRQQHTATVLLDGRVLVTGGFSFNPTEGNLSSAELFSLAAPTITVAMDIKPGNDPNAINPTDEGLVAVAILTTETFDATTVSPITVRFGPAEANLEHQLGHLEDVDSDGDLDLVLHFGTQESGIQCGDTEASLAGETFDGQAIQGSDSIVTVGCQ